MMIEGRRQAFALVKVGFVPSIICFIVQIDAGSAVFMSLLYSVIMVLKGRRLCL